MPTTVGSAQVRLAPSLTGFAQQLRTELRTIRTDDLTVGINPKLNRTAVNKVTRDLDKLTRARSVAIFASVDTRVAADEIAALTRNRTSTVRVDADTRVAADEINVLTRDRTVTIRTRTTGSSSTGSGSSAAGGDAADVAGTLVSLAPALAPVAAYLSSIALAGGAALASVGAFGAAVAPQIAEFTDLTAAQDKASSAVTQYGKSSQQAALAQDAVASTLDAMPAQTRTAAAAFLNLKSDFASWSDEMAKFTMVPVTQGLEIADTLLPKLSPLVKDTSGELTRLTTIAGGAVNTPGFDSLMGKFSAFSAGVMKDVVDDVVHFSRVLSEGAADGPMSEFMQYARQEGPEVRKVLTDVATAVVHVAEGVSEAGPGMLTLVGAVAHLVSALPAEFIGRALQVYTAFRLYKLASSGVTSLAGSVTSLSGRLTTLRTASTGAGGGLAGVRAAIASLSTGAKIGGTIAVIAGIVLVLNKLSGSGDRAPDVDRMTTAIGELGRTGKVTGEAARDFGTDLDGLTKSIDRLSGGGSGMDHFNDTMNKVFSLGMAKSNSLKDASKDVDAVDKSLASLVSGGKADLAAAAVARLSTEYAKSGKPASDLTSKLDNYQSALADAAFEQDLTAQSMGLFGAQAQRVQAQLDTQKKSADGLRQSIVALNDVNRAALSAESDFEQAIDDATKAINGHSHALTMTNGQLNLSSQAARDAYAPLATLAEKTDAATTAALDQGQSWAQVKATYDQGRASLIKTADAMGLTTSQAKTLADQILKTPDKTAYLTGNISDLKKKVDQAKSSLKGVPASKQTAIKGNIAQLNNMIRDAQAKIDALHGTSIDILTTYSIVNGVSTTVAHEGGDYGTKRATGGILPGYTPGRDVHQFYSPTAGRLHLSGGEAVMRPEWTQAVGPAFVNTMNALSRTRGIAAVRSAMGFKDGGILGGSFASGGIIDAKAPDVVYVAGKKINEGSIAAAIGNAFVTGLRGTTSQIQGSINTVVAAIRTAFKGAKTTVDDNLIKALQKQSAQLQTLATKRDSIKATIAAANSYASNATDSAKSFASLTNLPTTDGPVTATGILSGLHVQLGKIKKFSANLALLAKRGLSKTLIDQLVQAGPEQGSDYAQALADASAADLKSINNAQSAIDKSATAYGRNVADTMYDSGANAGKGFLTGLQSQEAAIVKEISSLAKTVQTTIEKDLKINSPSKVTEKLGGFTGEGFLVGLSSKHQAIAASAQRMAALVASAGPTSAGGTVSLRTPGGYAGGATVNVSYNAPTPEDPAKAALEFGRRTLAAVSI